MTRESYLRVSIGFTGGQVLAVRVASEHLEQLTAALSSPVGWFDLALEDGSVRLALPQVAYVRVDSDEPRVGFAT